MIDLYVDGVKFGEEEDIGNAMELKMILEETMPGSKITVEIRE